MRGRLASALDRRQWRALGAMAAALAALKTGQVDGVILSSSQGYALEKSHDGALLLEFGTYIKDFHTHVIFATNDLIASIVALMWRSSCAMCTGCIRKMTSTSRSLI